MGLFGKIGQALGEGRFAAKVTFLLSEQLGVPNQIFPEWLLELTMRVAIYARNRDFSAEVAADIVAHTEEVLAWLNSSDVRAWRGEIAGGDQSTRNEPPAVVVKSGTASQGAGTDDRTSECPDCNGTGLFKNEDICTRCKGWGTLPPPN